MIVRTLIIASLVLTTTASAAFRVHAEHEVRVEKSAIRKLGREERQLRAEIERLRFEVDVLESAPRLNELSRGLLPLAPGNAQQLADGERLRTVIDPTAARLESDR